MKQLLRNDQADVKLVGLVVGIFVTLIVAILVFYNVASNIDTSTIDGNFGGANETPSANATDSVFDQATTFFNVAPIIGIVVVAVVILGYVGRLGG